MAGMRAEPMNEGALRTRIVRLALALALPVSLAACGNATQEPVAPAPAPPRLDFPGKHRIPVRLDMRATADGGRATAIAGAWRGEFAFDGGGVARCGIERGGAGAIEPGASHEVRLICAAPVRLSEGGSRGFRVLEDGREIASGAVLP